MDAREFERIKGLINKTELEQAKNQGIVDTIKANWKKEYGTDDVFEIRKILSQLESRKEELEVKMESIYKKLVESCDWDEMERKLYG